MSVICKNTENGTIKLFCKGADTVIIPRMAAGQDALAHTTLKHLEEYANDGLRTLCLAYRILDNDTFAEWNKVYFEASLAITDREEKVRVIAVADVICVAYINHQNSWRRLQNLLRKN
jgi:magnesium-transporting ATPase (P-type)